MVLGRSFGKLSSWRNPDGFIYTTYHNSITPTCEPIKRWAAKKKKSGCYFRHRISAISCTPPADAVINRVCWVLGRTRPLEKQANCKFILLFVISSSLFFFWKEARFDLATSSGTIGWENGFLSRMQNLREEEMGQIECYIGSDRVCVRPFGWLL